MIKLDKDKKEDMIKSIKRIFLEQFDEEISDFKASIFLDFILNEAGVYIYNQAISDVYQLLIQKTEDVFSLEKRIESSPHLTYKI